MIISVLCDAMGFCFSLSRQVAKELFVLAIILVDLGKGENSHVRNCKNARQD